MGFSRQQYWSGLPLPSPSYMNDPYYTAVFTLVGFPGGPAVKESTSQCKRPRFNPWVGKIPRGREQLRTPVFWPGEFHGLYSPWGHKETDMIKQLSHSCSHCILLFLLWQLTPVFLPGESQGWQSLVGCRLWGCTESDMTETT